jgi:branched-chain amino acid aminotransferase
MTLGGSTDAIWIDGELHRAEGATVSAFDHGITVGDGLFETMKVVADEGGTKHAFALTRHLRRLRRSAAGLALPLAITDDDLRAAVRAVLDANAATAGRVRVTITGGIGPLGSDRSETRPTVIVATAPLPPWPATAAVARVPWRRNEHSAVVGLKTTSYVENVVALQRAHDLGASEAIFANTAGALCEGTGSNVFVGIGGRLCTPPLSSGCLAGITRELLVEHLDVEDTDLPLDRLHEVDELFLTSSTRDVQPVDQIDGQRVERAPGPITELASETFRSLERAGVDP